MYSAYITKLKNLKKHPNADRLQLGECFGNTVCVSLDYKEGQLGVYFPTDGQLSIIFAERNNLLRKKDNIGNNIGGYLDPDKRNIVTIKLRGEKSDGLFLTLDCLSTFCDIKTLKEGDAITTINGVLICEKYIPNKMNLEVSNLEKPVKKIKLPIAPMFIEHSDTQQLAYNLQNIKNGDLIEISLKMHGTSQRTGYLPVLKGFKRTFWDRILRKSGTPIYDYGYISGTRHTVLEDYEGGYYGDNAFREAHSKRFENKLWKGETVYYEIVGYVNENATIMNVCKNDKLGKDFVRKYGESTIFHYGCGIGQSETYVYRMTITSPEGNIIEYSPELLRLRCEQMGVQAVPVFETQLLKEENSEILAKKIMQLAEKYAEGADPIGKAHIKEGVVVRIINKTKFTAFKHKSFEFKVLEGIVKDAATKPDIEEVQELVK